jgi:hypothetical protein
MPQQNILQHNMMMQPNMMQAEMMMMQPNVMQPNMMMLDMTQQNMIMDNRGAEQSLLQAKLYIVGNKTKTSNNCCFYFTVISGSFIILPLFFMCCMWWKKIVYPFYELSVDAYQNIANLIARSPNMNNLTLTITDNAFNAQKARILYDALSRSRVMSLSFSNRALACNNQSN